MKIAIGFESIDPRRGGAETYVVDLLRGLIQRGCRVDLFASSWRPDEIPDSVQLHRVDLKGSDWPRSWRTRHFAQRCAEAIQAKRDCFDCVVGLIGTIEQDVLIPQGGVRQASLEYNAQRFQTKWGRHLYKMGKWLNPKWWTDLEIERRQYSSHSRTLIVAVSHFVKSHLMRYHAVSEDRIRVIPNAVHLDRLRITSADRERARALLRSRYGIGLDTHVGLFVGHNFRLKGIEPLFRGFRAFLDTWAARNPGFAPPIMLLVCGGGRPEPFQNLAVRLNIADRVQFAGFLPEIRQAYLAADFFVSPTFYDPCSLVVFEALVHGLPVITTAQNGAGEILCPGREGFVLKTPYDTPGLIAAFDQLLNPKVLRQMSVAAERLGREQSFDRHVDRLLDVFDEAARLRRDSGSFTRSRRRSVSHLESRVILREDQR